MNPDWMRVTKANPCPISKHDSWCAIGKRDGSVMCMRVESKHQCGEGWLHPSKAPTNRKRTFAARPQPSNMETVTNWEFLADYYRKAAKPNMIATLAKSLGLIADSLRRLNVGWDGEAWCAPMRNHKGAVVGIRRRFPDGKKLSVHGGKEGLFYDPAVAINGLTLVVEGFTDTAAAITLGFSAIGRPSCSGGTAFVLQMCADHPTVVIADDDAPGLRGARLLVKQLPNGKLFVPPAKDLRSWLLNGATKDDVLAIMGLTKERALTTPSRYANECS
jgi:hypothetical protein